MLFLVLEDVVLSTFEIPIVTLEEVVMKPEYAFLRFGLDCEENTLSLGDEDWVGVDGLGFLRLGYEAFIRSIGIFYASLQEQQNTIIIHLLS